MYLVRRTWAEQCLERFERPIATIATNEVRTAELITRSAMTHDGLIAYPPLGVEDLSESLICPNRNNHIEAVRCWGDAAYAE